MLRELVTNSWQPRVDSEGYSEKPETIDEITRIQREASGLDESALNLTIRDQPIFEDESQAKRAMDDMANTLRLVGALPMPPVCSINLLSAHNKLESAAIQEHYAVDAMYGTLCSFQTHLPPGRRVFLLRFSQEPISLCQPHRSHLQSM